MLMMVEVEREVGFRVLSCPVIKVKQNNSRRDPFCWSRMLFGHREEVERMEAVLTEQSEPDLALTLLGSTSPNQ
jgi:hypothetical protein